MKYILDHNSYVPLYVQIRDILRDLIEKHEDPQLPFHSDNELAEMFSVNRLTVRRSIQELVDEGLLHRVKGVGTFVRSPMVEGDLIYPRGFMAQWHLQGKKVKAKLISTENITAPYKVTSMLNIEAKSQVFYIQRLRYANGLPVILDDIYLPHLSLDSKLFTALEKNTVQWLLRTHVGIAANVALIELEAVQAQSRHEEYLQVKINDPLLKRNLTLASETGVPLSYGESFHRPELFKYRLRVPISEES
jgi:GntR family transcriptional regulator